MAWSNQTRDVATVAGGIALADSYSESNADNYWELTNTGYRGIGQAFTVLIQNFNKGLYSAKFYIKRVGSPTGNVVAKLYAMSGSYGTTAQPTGAALATSDVVDITTISTSYALVTFLFSGVNKIVLNGSNYIITIEYSDGAGVNHLTVQSDASSPAHNGNMCYKNRYDIWTYYEYDVCFYVYYEVLEDWTNSTKNTSSYSNQSKNSANFTNQSKNTNNFTNQSKNTSTYTNQSKS